MSNANASITAMPQTKKSADSTAKVQARVRKMEARKITAGARRMPGGLLCAEASQSIDLLIKSGCATNITQAINESLIRWAKEIEKQSGNS